MDGIARLLSNPVLLVDRTGAVLDLNEQARTLIASPVPARASEIFEPSDRLAEIMSRATGTSDPVLGALYIRTRGGERRHFRTRVLAMRSGGTLQIAIQLLDKDSDAFSDLSRRITAFNREVAVRRAVYSRLEKTLARNIDLFRELQHREKNHLQMMLSLFSIARREAREPGEQALVEKFELKLRAICEAQQIMHTDDDPGGVAGAALVTALTRLFRERAGEAVTIDVDAEAVRVSNETAFSLALIVNELLSNAVEHGMSGSGDHIRVALHRAGEDFELAVSDNGPGFTPAEPTRRSTGLGLVRGLCQHLGGAMNISGDAGTCVRVRLSGRL